MKTFTRHLLAVSLGFNLVASGWADESDLLPKLMSPAGRRANTANCGGVMLSWGAVPGAAGYHVVLSGTASAERTSFTNSLVITDLPSGNYSYMVKSLGTPGEFRDSDYSAADGFFVNACVVCTQPPVVSLSVSPESIWPPNGKLVPVVLSGSVGVVPPCSLMNASFSVLDEYGMNQFGSLPLGADGGSFTTTVYVSASRMSGDHDGHLYRFVATALDSAGQGTSPTATSAVLNTHR